VADVAESQAAAEPAPIAEMEVEAVAEVAAADVEAAAVARIAGLLRRLRAAHGRNRRLRRDVRRLEKQVARLQEPAIQKIGTVTQVGRLMSDNQTQE
jgi:hypothetical protein